MTCCKNSIAVEEQHTRLAEQKAVQFKEKIKSQEETNRRKRKGLFEERTAGLALLLCPCENYRWLYFELDFSQVINSQVERSPVGFERQMMRYSPVGKAACPESCSNRPCRLLVMPAPLSSQGTHIDSLLVWQKADLMVNFVCAN